LISTELSFQDREPLLIMLKFSIFFLIGLADHFMAGTSTDNLVNRAAIGMKCSSSLSFWYDSGIREKDLDLGIIHEMQERNSGPGEYRTRYEIRLPVFR
jgi:hypothetical protein